MPLSSQPISTASHPANFCTIFELLLFSFMCVFVCECVLYRCEPPAGPTVKECAPWWCSRGNELVSLKDVRWDPDVWRSKYLLSGDKLASVSQSVQQIIYDGGLVCNFFPVANPVSCFLFGCVYPSPKGNVVREVFSGRTQTGRRRKTSNNLATLTRPLIRDVKIKKA